MNPNLISPAPTSTTTTPSTASVSSISGRGKRRRLSQVLLEPGIVRDALFVALARLNPLSQWRNPVMFVTWIGAAFTTALFIQALVGHGEAPAGFIFVVALFLWLTVGFANFAEAMAEGRGKAQAASLRSTRHSVMAKKLAEPRRDAAITAVTGPSLRKGDVVLVEAGDMIPTDGEAILGIATVNESAITGESAPVIRESGGDRCGVTGGTTVLSDWLVIRVTADPGQTFLDRIVSLVEGAKRKKTPNEIALEIFLAGLTLVFVLVCATLLPLSIYSVAEAGQGEIVSVTALIALLVCLIPTTIGGLLSSIGIAGMDRMMRANVIATSGRAVEAAGDIDVLLLDKTGTITFGNRQATRFIPAPNVTLPRLIEASRLASMGDDTPEGRSIVKLAGAGANADAPASADAGASVVPFTAQTRMSGLDLTRAGRLTRYRKGAIDAVTRHVALVGGTIPPNVQRAVDDIARGGATPLVVCEDAAVLGVIELKDVIKPGIKDRFAQLRRMGIRTVMITGDNPLTAAAIAAEAGVDDFLAESTPEKKLEKIREYQAKGHLVAMTGDGTNDAPALAQADVAVAMNAGTQAAKEAANMVDLDSSPTKLLEVVEVGKQLLMTRGALTTFSIANDVAKYFAILPAAFATVYPQLKVLNVMGLTSSYSAILAAVIFNALIIVALIPLALRGVPYRAEPAAATLSRNLLLYGVGGLIVPFVGIKLIDALLTLCGLTFL